MHFRGIKQLYFCFYKNGDVRSMFSYNEGVCIVMTKTNQSGDAIDLGTTPEPNNLCYWNEDDVNGRQAFPCVKYLSFKKLRPVTAEVETIKYWRLLERSVNSRKHLDNCWIRESDLVDAIFDLSKICFSNY